ncbi:MAG: glycosyltransferase [Candidatus Obscuribacterales bacterium]|nr:glycosyltransferase [Candidatus Obscuribacterales bacterium]
MPFLKECIESVLAQNSPDWLCVIVDGNSSDGSREYLQQFQSDPRFVIRQGLQKGMYSDWNYCLNFVETEYFSFLPSDDKLLPNFAGTVIGNMNQFPNIDMCHVGFDYLDQQGNVIETFEQMIQAYMPAYSICNSYRHIRDGRIELLLTLQYGCIYRGGVSLAFRKSLTNRAGLISTEFGPAGDVEWEMRLVMSTNVLFIPHTLCQFRIYDEQATARTTYFQKFAYLAEMIHANHNLIIRAAEELNDHELISAVHWHCRNRPAFFAWQSLLQSIFKGAHRGDFRQIALAALTRPEGLLIYAKWKLGLLRETDGMIDSLLASSSTITWPPPPANPKETASV